MLPHDPDNLFEDDLADLLNSFENSDSSPPSLTQADADYDLDIEDLDSLFNDNLAQEEQVSEGNLSSLPSEKEIQAIFSEDLSWEEEEGQNTPIILDTDEIIDFGVEADYSQPLPPSTSTDIDSEIINLLTENLTDEDIFYPEILRGKPAGEAHVWDELEQLLADETEPLSKAPEFIPLLEKSLSIKAQDHSYYPYFYETVEELDYLIQAPATLLEQELKSQIIIDELEALINAPCAINTVQEAWGREQVPDAVTEKPPQKQDNELDAIDRELNRMIEQSGHMGASAAPIKKPNKPRTMEQQIMRVPIKQLDNLSNLIGELVVKRNRLEQDQERLRLFLDNLLNQVQQLSDIGGRMQDLYERTLLEGALLASRNRARQQDQAASNTSNNSKSTTNQLFDQDLDALEMDHFTDFHLLSQEMIELIVRVRESASDIQFIIDETDQVARNLRQVSTQLQEGMTKSRMVPFAQTADRLPLAIRKISVDLNKQAKLHVEGRDVLIDKMIIEHLSDPMIHLINNAMTHGIEDPEKRIQKGKSPEGRIMVRAFIQGNQTIISMSDDGAGIDVNKIKRKALEKKLITPEEVNILTEQELYDFLFYAGFSTKDKADNFSGRGVGLDVVRKDISEVRGTVTIDSTLGKGTTFTIRLPLTVSISKALCCLSNHARIAFPMDGVEDMKDFLPSEIKTNAQGQPCIPWYDGTIPFQPLSDLLPYNRQLSRGSVYGGRQEEDTISIIILRSAGNFLAVQVDQVLGEQEIVIKQIEGPLPKPAGIAGATVLGDGTVMPIGDVLELMEISQGRIPGSSNTLHKVRPQQIAPQDLNEPTVLIVDDSITVREILSLSFNKAGYRVEQARDGQEAWEKLRSGLPCDIVFCDIEMPRMNGLELLSNIQKDEKLAHIPVAVLSSRGAEKHRKVAAKLGASGYFTKPYTEKDLLDAAKRMMAGEILLAGSIRPKRKPKLETNTLARENTTSTSPFKDTISEITSNIIASPASVAQKSEHLVLIVDDSVMVREMLSMTFGKVGYEIEQARDGQEAWEKLRSGLSCDLILCDIEMPRMNGLELLSRLQEDEKLSAIPIAMITSRGAQKMQNIAAERGAKGYFVKPYIDSVLLDAAKRLIAGEVLLEKANF